jgi:predicted small secreted protein
MAKRTELRRHAEWRVKAAQRRHARRSRRSAERAAGTKRLPCFHPKPVQWTKTSDLFHRGRFHVPARPVLTIAAMGLALIALTACGNTIRGIGRDMGNAVDATQDAGRSVANSVN